MAGPGEGHPPPEPPVPCSGVPIGEATLGRHDDPDEVEPQPLYLVPDAVEVTQALNGVVYLVVDDAGPCAQFSRSGRCLVILERASSTSPRGCGEDVKLHMT